LPLDNLHRTTTGAWGLWRIEEPEEALVFAIGNGEGVPASITHEGKRLEYLAARLLLKELLRSLDHSFSGITKDEFGKPYLNGSNYQISLSHSYPYVAAIINDGKAVGIDLEQPKPKLLKIAPRILAKDELSDAGTDVIKHCIYWCAKESMIKIHGKKDLIFAENIRLKPFSRAKYGHLIGRIIANRIETTVPLQYYVFENFVVVLSA
jgi:4'-phosphopantetheinyl transferase EntD